MRRRTAAPKRQPIRRRPPPRPAARAARSARAAQIITRQRYEDPRFVQRYSERRGARPRAYEGRLLRRMLALARGIHPGRSSLLVVDLGMGYGRDLAWLQAQRRVKAFGADYAHAMLRRAQRHRGVRPESLVQMDIRRLGFRNRSVDVARAQAVFHHLSAKDADAAMEEVSRILKPGGLAHVFVREGTFEGMRSESGLGRRYFRYLTPRAATALLRRHGLTVLEHETVMTPTERGVPCLALFAAKSSRAARSASGHKRPSR